MVLSNIDRNKWSLGLQRVREALDILGHPERTYPHVLVAGTNGKGSTCMYLERILMGAGLKVGTTMSPHVSRFEERFRINGTSSTVSELKALREEMEPLIEDIALTYFEWCVVLAVRLFEKNKVDAGIFEVGLGGRYDASNALDPAVSVITEISLDHTDYLGHTKAAIAREKADIARPGRPLVTSATGEAHKVIEDHARDCGARLYEITHASMEEVGLSGGPQKCNAALALTAARHLGVNLCASGLDHALRTAFLPGRIEALGGRIIMDVAHNPSSMLVLVEHLKNSGFSGVGVAGILSDKDYASMIEILRSACTHLYIAPVQSPRSWGEDDLRRIEATGGVTVCRSVRHAFDSALESLSPVVVTGSFYTVGEVRELLVCPGWSS